jgi:cytochrome P450
MRGESSGALPALSSRATSADAVQTFTPDKLVRYMADMAVVVKRRLAALPEAGEMDIFPFAYDLVLELIITILLGVLPAAQAADLAFHMKETDIELYMSNPLNVLFPSLTHTRRHKAYDALKAHLRAIIQTRKAQGVVRDDLLTITLARYGEDNFDSVFGIVWSTILAATINQFAATSWLMYHAATNADCREKLSREVVGLGDDYSRFLESTPYLEAALREVTRITTMGISARKALSPVPIGKTVVPAGSTVLFLHSSINMDASVFENPTQFNPDRLLHEGAGLHEQLAREYKLLVFGGGRHPCPGMRLSSTIIKVVFSMLHRGLEYSFKEAPVMPAFQALGILRPTKPLLMTFRKKAAAAGEQH